MKRIINALRYGDRETKLCIGKVTFFSILGIGFIIASGVTGLFPLFIIGMLAGVVAIILSQTFTLVDEDFVAEVDTKGKKDTVSAVSANMSEKSIQKKAAKAEEKRKDIENKAKEKVAQFAHYNEQTLKMVKRKYHVKKDHRPIIIEYSKTYKIKECPAFIWRVHNKVFLLLLEKEPRKIAISRELIKHLEYVPNVRGIKEKEYLAFKEDTLVAKVFEGYLPDYFVPKNPAGNLRYKNLYAIYPDIQISNRSASKVMDLLYLNFMPKDKITSSDKINGYFKKIYAANILYKDRVYSITEYKDVVEQVLKELCCAEIPRREFDITLDNLVRARLISKEYADYYTELKEKEDSKKLHTHSTR